ncbi:MAG: 16S rRNA (adenine(1518)-N(6)/adenine(1519)-N(6))-dimethyltransferase RsmA [Succinivibrio sp.]|nr:16S rRNA (adenine(1518)-N(6)/adenine(1519)-N(6))-dimethyltransferase RsmA [Succinivibrio sp.]
MALPPSFMKARKRFGQNFLVDEQVITKIVNAINPKVGEHLVEIGPGHAALTRPVLERCKSLTAIELDRDLCELLAHDPFLKGLRLISADALKVQLDELIEGESLRVFGNLPYNITSPLIFHLLAQKHIADLHFMLQKEVVERLCAGPNHKDFGRLTIMVQYQAQVIPLFEVPNTAFRPKPQVTSAVVRLIPKQLDEHERELIPYLNALTTEAFSARRKTLRNALQKSFTEAELMDLELNPELRAENLSVEQFARAAQALYEKQRREAF